MAEKTVDFDEKTEVGGFNPERRNEKKKEQVGPAPTDDPHHELTPEIKRKVEESLTKLPPG